MSKSNKISAQFDRINNYLELANQEFQKLPIEYINEAEIYEFHTEISNLIDRIEDLHYETCMPLEMEEEERAEEIRVLERRLAELKTACL